MEEIFLDTNTCSISTLKRNKEKQQDICGGKTYFFKISISSNVKFFLPVFTYDNKNFVL